MSYVRRAVMAFFELTAALEELGLTPALSEKDTLS